MESINEMDNLIKSEKKKYYLMHKDIKVLEFTTDLYNTYEEKILNAEHLPLYFQAHTLDNLNIRLYNWIKRRIIPASRFQYDRLISCLKMDGLNRLEFIIENKALSLSDCYWIKAEESDDTWSKVNYFENEFNQDLVDLYIDSTISPDYKNLIPLTPSNTLDGYLPKAWIIENNQRRLIKRSCHFDFEASNEDIIFRIMAALDIDVAPVIAKEYKCRLISCCDCFCNSNIEFINADDYTDVYCRKPLWGNARCFCDALCKIYGNDNKFYEMVEMDFILANRDRHWNNFGLLRNAHTLEYIAMAPIFDNGNSLWYNKQLNKIGTNDIYTMYKDMTLFDIDKIILRGKRIVNLDKIESALHFIKDTDLYDEQRKTRIYDECCRWLQILR